MYTIAPSTRVDASPAIHAFIVEAPWWRNPVVGGPGLVLIIAVLFQSARVVQRDKRLRDANQAMSDANKELFQVNVDLQREQVLERLRGQAQGMRSSEDIKQVVEAVNRELSGLGLSLVSSGIHIAISETESETWTVAESGRAFESFIRESTSFSVPIQEAQRRGDDYFHCYLEGEEVTEVLRQEAEGGNPRWEGIPEERWPQKVNLHFVFFDEGAVRLFSEEPIAKST